MAVPRPTTMRRPLLAAPGLAGVLVLSLLSACGDAEPPRAGSGPSATASADPATSLRVTCGRGVAWPVTAMERGIESSTPRDEVEAALVDLVERAGIDAPRALQGGPIDEASWFVLAEEPERIAVATGPWSARGPGPDGQVVYLEPEGDGWRASGWGGCRQLSPVLDPGQQWVRVYGVTRPDPLSTRLTVTVGEVECTSARDPSPYLRKPTVVESAEMVLVSWTSDAVVGGATCPGNPTVTQTLELTAPLGDRVLRDGSTWPYSKVPVRD